MLRPYRDADSEALARHGLTAKTGSSILVHERDGEITAALSFARLPFETAQLGLAAARIDQCLNFAHADADFRALLKHTEWHLREAGIALVTCRFDDNQRQTTAALQDQEFRVIECLLTLGRNLSPDADGLPIGVELATADDADGCGHVAAGSFKYNRFRADPDISDQAADDLKAEWARNSCRGRADAVFVMRDAGRITGFNACLKGRGGAIIDLIAVLPEMHGRGIGRRLVDAALAHYADTAERITVGTQSANTASLALYQSAGFRIEASAFTLHKHLGASTQ